MALTEQSYLTIQCVVWVLATTLFALRLYLDISRYLVRTVGPGSAPQLWSLGWAFVGWIFYVATFSLSMWRGHRVLVNMDAPPVLKVPALGVVFGEAELSLKILIIPNFTVPTGVWCVKASFMSMFITLMQHMGRRLRLLMYLIISYLVASYIVVMIVYFAWCQPFATRWLMTIDGYCNVESSPATLILYTALNVSGDAAIMMIPILLRRELRLQRRDKYGLGFLLMLGTLTISVSIARCLMMISLSKTPRLSIRYENTLIPGILVDAELAASMIAVSLPSLRAFLYRHMERQRSRSSSTGFGSWRSGSKKKGSASGTGQSSSGARGEGEEEELQLFRSNTVLRDPEIALQDVRPIEPVQAEQSSPSTLEDYRIETLPLPEIPRTMRAATMPTSRETIELEERVRRFNDYPQAQRVQWAHR